MRKLSALILVMAVAGLVAPTAAAAQQVGGENDAVCTFSFTLRFSPGITLTPAGPAQQADDGQVNCTGNLQGRAITGVGTLNLVDGRLENSNCLFDHSIGKYVFTVPTDEGPLTIEGTYDVIRTGLTFSIAVEQPGANGNGSGIVVPTKGDCVVTPLTESLVVLTIKFADASAPRTTCDLNLGVVLVNCRTSSRS